MTRTAFALFLGALTLPACEQDSSTTIGPRGGQVISEDGRLALTVPAGALQGEVEITISDSGELPTSALGYTYELSPRGTAFAIPATITFELEADDMTFEGLSLVSERQGQWYYMADRVVDLEDMTVSASATYLSTFAVVADLTSADGDDHDHDHDHDDDDKGQ